MTELTSGSSSVRRSLLTRCVKRVIDLLVAVALIIVTAPILFLAALCTVVTSGLPVLYRQQRVGLHERPFTLYKMRTMRSSTGSEIELLTDADRLTRTGRLIRRLSIDELPQLWNVLRGDMSLVGPRPLLDLHLPLYTTEQRRRHLVRPGLTGLAQVAGRREMPFSQRFALDVRYVDTWTLWLDITLLFRTLVQVMKGSGAIKDEDISKVDDIGLTTVVKSRGE